ncbi:MAG: transporter substrate-binding domain-containing protein [Anaerolineae bacterium]|nr:transporter substrate-binding domain-containing protein [Anaerolineae bacterium]
MKRILYICLILLLALPVSACQSRETDVTHFDNVLLPESETGIWEEITLTSAEEAWLSAGHTVHVYAHDWPPFMVVDGQQVEGLAMDYVELIFKRHNIAYQYIVDPQMSWHETLAHMQNHEVVDMVPTINHTSERESYINFTQDYLFFPWVVITREDADFVSTLDDLRGKVVSVPYGFVIQDLIEKNYPEIKLLPLSDSGEDILRMLATGQTDAHIGNLGVATYIIKEEGFTNLKIAAPTPFEDHDQAMGIRDDWPELAGIIDKSLAAMTVEQHAAIRNRWLAVRYEHGLSKRDFWIRTAQVVGATFALLLAVLFWNNRLQKEIKERTKELEEAQECLVRREKLAVLGQMAGSVGHELRNPLGVISNAVYFMRSVLTAMPESDVLLEYLGIIEEEEQKSERIVSDLLDFARVKTAYRSPVAIKELVQHIVGTCSIPDSITVDIQVADDIPDVFMDYQQIEQVLNNLMANAIQAMPEGGQLSMGAAVVDHCIALSITDTGYGIPPENMEKIFEPLFTTKAQGIGLGLPISKNLVEANGGFIEVQSVPGEGATFTIMLPFGEEMCDA